MLLSTPFISWLAWVPKFWTTDWLPVLLSLLELLDSIDFSIGEFLFIESKLFKSIELESNSDQAIS